jgi:hypothetical protein
MRKSDRLQNSGHARLWSTIVVGGLTLTACAAGPDGPAGESDMTRIESALTVGQDFCVFGRQGIAVGDRGITQGLVGSGGLFDAGLDARINGTTLVNGNGILRDRSRLTGDLTLSGTLSRAPSAVVTGTIRQSTPVTLPTLFSQSIPAGTTNVNIAPGSNTRLTNGGYGAVLIGARSTVRLSGTYDVTSFVVDTDVTLLEDPPGSGIQINSVGALTFGDRDILRASDPTGVSLYSNAQTLTVGTAASITGILDAPAAAITIGSRTRMNGCVGGARLTLQPDALITSSNPNATLPVVQQCAPAGGDCTTAACCTGLFCTTNSSNPAIKTCGFQCIDFTGGDCSVTPCCSPLVCRANGASRSCQAP